MLTHKKPPHLAMVIKANTPDIHLGRLLVKELNV